MTDTPFHHLQKICFIRRELGQLKHLLTEDSSTRHHSPLDRPLRQGPQQPLEVHKEQAMRYLPSWGLLTHFQETLGQRVYFKGQLTIEVIPKQQELKYLLDLDLTMRLISKINAD